MSLFWNPTDITNNRRCVSNSPQHDCQCLNEIGQSRRVLKSWYTGGGPERGFRRCFVDGLKFRRGTCVCGAGYTESLLGNQWKPLSRSEVTNLIGNEHFMLANISLVPSAINNPQVNKVLTMTKRSKRVTLFFVLF